MILGVYKDDKKVINNYDIKYQMFKEYAYGVAYEVRIGVYGLYEGFKLKEKYKLYDSENKDLIELGLFSIEQETIGVKDLTIYTFMADEYIKILNNLMPLDLDYNGVKFEDYVEYSNSQMKYYIFNVRKKGMIQTYDKDKIVSTEHIQTVLGNPLLKINEYFDYREIDNYQNKALNYYTVLEDGSVEKTQNGKTLHKYLPFAKADEIQGLDTYLIPKYEVRTNDTIMKLGDRIEVGDDNCVVIEKEKLIYNGNIKSFLVLGVEI